MAHYWSYELVIFKLRWFKLFLVYTLQYLGNDQWENTWKRAGQLQLARDSGRVSKICAKVFGGAVRALVSVPHCDAVFTACFNGRIFLGNLP